MDTNYYIISFYLLTWVITLTFMAGKSAIPSKKNTTAARRTWIQQFIVKTSNFKL